MAGLYYELLVGLTSTNSVPQLNLLIAAPSGTDPLLYPYNGGNICSGAMSCPDGTFRVASEYSGMRQVGFAQYISDARAA